MYDDDHSGNDAVSKARFQKLLREVEQKELHRRNAGRYRSDSSGSSTWIGSLTSAGSNSNGKAGKTKWTKYRWLQFGVYLWAGRLGMVMIGGMIPAFISLLSGWFTGISSSTKSEYKGIEEVSVNGLSRVKSWEWLNLLKDDFSAVSHWRNDYEIQLIRKVPVISAETIELLFNSLIVVPPVTHRPSLKIQSSKQILHEGNDMDDIITEDIQQVPNDGRYFSYFTEDRPWSTYYARSYEYLRLDQYLTSFQLGKGDGDISSSSSSCSIRFPPHRFIDKLRAQSDVLTRIDSSTENKVGFTHYMYLAYPHLLPYLESFAPSLALISKYLAGTNVNSPNNVLQASLWISSPNVSAVMHYDLDDNFLLQLSGNKTVVIASPEAAAFVKPYSSLHPLWRQSSIDQLVDAETLLALREDFAAEDSLERELAEVRRKRGQGKGVKKLETSERQTTNSSRMFSDGSRALIWQVEIHPGDMLYIPAGYFHSVITGNDSVSINAWHGSSLSNLYKKFSRVSLPFTSEDTVTSRLSDVVGILRHLSTQLGWDRDYLVQAMRRKYSDDLISKMTSGTTMDQDHCPALFERFCTKTSLHVAGT